VLLGVRQMKVHPLMLAASATWRTLPASAAVNFHLPLALIPFRRFGALACVGRFAFLMSVIFVHQDRRTRFGLIALATHDAHQI